MNESTEASSIEHTSSMTSHVGEQSAQLERYGPSIRNDEDLRRRLRAARQVAPVDSSKHDTLEQATSDRNSKQQSHQSEKHLPQQVYSVDKHVSLRGTAKHRSSPVPNHPIHSQRHPSDTANQQSIRPRSAVFTVALLAQGVP